MGKRGNWFSSVKKAISPDSKEKKEQKAKKKWFGKQKEVGSNSTSDETSTIPAMPPAVEVKQEEVEDHNQIKHAYGADVDSTAPLEVTLTAAHPSAQGITVTRFAGKSKEEVAAIIIQIAYRGYMARKALRALRGLVRLKSLMEGSVAKRQAANTLKCMQTLSRVQSQIRSRRMRMSEENQALQRQLIEKHAKELALRMGEEWDDSVQSKQQVEANLLSKHEAAIRRERAMAYAFSHQQSWKNSSRHENPMFTDPSNPTWGWSWLERWMAARPWESRGMTEKEVNGEQSVKNANRNNVGGEISKSYVRKQLNSDKPSPTASHKPSPGSSLQSPSTPMRAASSTVARKLKPFSQKGIISSLDDESKSMVSVQSDRFRRHSVAGSSVRDDESLASCATLPSYMVATESARAKAKSQSPLALMIENSGIAEKGGLGSAKKRLSYPASPARPRRHSGPPKVDSSINAEITVSNGSGS